MGDRYEDIEALVDRLRHAPVDRALCYDAAKMIAALREQDRWYAIDDPEHPAPKDGTRILVILKNPLPVLREDLDIWNGITFVARHPGLAGDGFDVGWNFAAPVGCGGFPDEWIAGWRPLPAPPPDTGRDTATPDTGGGR